MITPSPPSTSFGRRRSGLWWRDELSHLWWFSRTRLLKNIRRLFWFIKRSNVSDLITFRWCWRVWIVEFPSTCLHSWQRSECFSRRFKFASYKNVFSLHFLYLISTFFASDSSVFVRNLLAAFWILNLDLFKLLRHSFVSSLLAFFKIS